jgi:hypothetical protein
MDELRAKVIRLAHERSDLRSHLLPLLNNTTASVEKEANAALVKAVFMACASSTTCRKLTAKALRLPDAIHDRLSRYAGATGQAALEKAGLDPEQIEFAAKLADVGRQLGRIPQAPMLLLADLIEGMSEVEADAIKALV